MPTKNWVYGAKAPDIEQAVSDAIFNAHNYRNKLCELELAKRERHEALLQRLAPEYVSACRAVESEEALLSEARKAIQAERVRQQTKKPDGVQSHVDAAAAAKVNLKNLRATRKAAKHAAYDDPNVQAAMAANQQQHKDAQAEAKRESGLYWGTEAIVKQACASFSSGAPPRYKRYEGEGQLAVQLQGGLDTREATEPDTRLQLLVSDELQEALSVTGQARGTLRRAEALVRIGSAGRSPVFARVPIVMHRPLPPGKIKWAYLERRKMANKAKWYLRLTVDVPDSNKPRPDGMVALHVGWRNESQGLRVATALGSDGKWRYLRLEDKHLADYDRLDAVRSERDLRFNNMRDRLSAWIKERSNLPEFLIKAIARLNQRRSPAILSKLVSDWSDERFAGDDIWDDLEAWRKWNKHRWQHECRLRARVIRRRTDLYRNFAAQLSKDYGTVIVAPIEAKKLTEHSNPEDLERDLSVRRAKQAAVSDLIQKVREKFPLRCVQVEAAGMSQTCANCGHVNHTAHRKVQCGECHITYDVDENAVTITLARGEVAVNNGALLELEAAQRDREEKQQAKLSKMQAANRAARKRKRESVS